MPGSTTSKEEAGAKAPVTPPTPPIDVVHAATQVFADLFVFAPLGFAKRARTLLPELVREGRSTARSAQLIGRFAVPVLKKQGKRAVERTVADVIKRPAARSNNGNDTPKNSGPAVSPVSTPRPPRAEVAAAVVLGEPFAGFEHLGSAAVIARLGELTQPERNRVREYERAHRNRRTVLGRLDQLDSVA